MFFAAGWRICREGGSEVGMRFSIYSLRHYGQPRLKKPKELRGVKQVFSVNYIYRKCKCQIFIHGGDVWVRHNDYFSPSMKLPPEDVGKPLGYLAEKYLGKKRAAKRQYEDAWGSIVLRRQAWLKIANLYWHVQQGTSPLKLWNEIRRQQEVWHDFEEGDLYCTAMERFWERAVLTLYEKNGKDWRGI